MVELHNGTGYLQAFSSLHEPIGEPIEFSDSFENRNKKDRFNRFCVSAVDRSPAVDKLRKGRAKLSITIRIAAIPADGHEWRPAIRVAYPEDKMDAWKAGFA